MKRFISTILTLAIVLVMALSTVAMAAPGINVSPQGGSFEGLAGTILGYVQWVGYAIAIGMLIYIGIKYVTASADTKADLKTAMIKYVIGAILIAAASTIAGWLYDIGSGIK